MAPGPKRQPCAQKMPPPVARRRVASGPRFGGILVPSRYNFSVAIAGGASPYNVNSGGLVRLSARMAGAWVTLLPAERSSLCRLFRAMSSHA